MKFISVFATLFLYAIVSIAQEKILLKGTIKDAKEQPIELANIVAIDPQTSTIKSYGVSGENGDFSLELRAGREYQIKVSYVGFQPFEKLVRITSSPSPLNVVLEEDAVALEALETFLRVV